MEQTMSPRLNFDKLKFVKKLQGSGQTPEYAEALADAFDDALTQSQSTLLTKQDFELRMTQFESRFAQFETKILKLVGTAIISSTTIIIAMMGLFKIFG